MSAQQNKASVRRLVEEFWNKGNVAVADEIAAPNFVMHILPPGTPPGAESLKRFAAMVRTAFPDIHFSIEDEVAEGDRVAVRLIATGTHLGPYVNGLTTPTGKRFSMPGMDIWRFDGEGKWAECWSTYDTLSQLQQLGALPAAGPHAREAAPANPAATLAG